MFDFEYQLKILPEKPGVYLMKNSLGEIIYVGKAKILKNRVRQYFQNNKNHTQKVKAMVKHIAEFEYIITDSEMEALILEGNLIKKYRPRYNIALKDDKFYPFIKITTNEDFPRVYMTRTFVKDGNKYFGPYTNVTAVHETMELIKKLFPLRTCRMNITEGMEPVRPCLNYDIKKCTAPCAGKISKEEYKETINEIIDILNGKDKTVINKLKQDMQEASQNLEFEKAAGFRDKILAINNLASKQKVFRVVEGDEDFINIYKDEKDTCVQIFFMREGKITGREHFIIEDSVDEDDGSIIQQVISSFYSGTGKIAKTIYVPVVDNLELLEEFLTIKRGSKVWIKTPQRGEKKDLLELVKNNAKLTLSQFKDKIIKEKEINRVALEELQEMLQLDYIPHRIEAYDISNIQGADSVGSMIVFEGGKAKNSDYRKFRIKTVQGADDYSSMREVLTRRFEHGLKEIKEIQARNLEFSKGKFSNFPDLIMMDGGKGQINIALEVLNELGISIDVCGLVKDDKHNTRGIIFNNEEILIARNSNLMQLIRRVQDEVHRFAITFHRTVRDKRILHSVLDDIPNVGEKRKIALLKNFGSVDNIKKASLQELQTTPLIDKKSAASIYSFFNDNKE
ncbi:MAG: excinuclease ABC subunit UvrC [Clostridiaceae bacterium]|nr:excinuclease ABC subunit UvrC [Clostridiaceae bacterium]